MISTITLRPTRVTRRRGFSRLDFLSVVTILGIIATQFVRKHAAMKVTTRCIKWNFRTKCVQALTLVQDVMGTLIAPRGFQISRKISDETTRG